MPYRGQNGSDGQIAHGVSQQMQYNQGPSFFPPQWGPRAKKRRRTTNEAEDSEDEDLDEDDDNWSDNDEHASGSRPRKSRSGRIKRREYSAHAPDPSASGHQVARLTEEVRVLRQRVKTLEGIIQKAQSSAALLTSQLQVPPSDFS